MDSMLKPMGLFVQCEELKKLKEDKLHFDIQLGDMSSKLGRLQLMSDYFSNVYFCLHTVDQGRILLKT